MRTNLIQGLDLPAGWLWDDEQVGGDATVTWPRVGLTLVIADEQITKRRTLNGRFQLFDVKDHGFKKVADSESLSDILVVFDKIRASR